MDFFVINQMPMVDRTYCFLEWKPEEIPIRQKWRLTKGYPMEDHYPGDSPWYMSDEYPGFKLPSLIGNVSNMLVLHQDLARVIEATGVPMELLKFTLHNHKKRVASRDYVIVNPLGTFDCLNYDESKIQYTEEDKPQVVGVDKRVFDSRKMAEAPDVFRILEEPREIVISHKVVEELKKLNPTNVYLHRVEQAP